MRLAKYPRRRAETSQKDRRDEGLLKPLLFGSKCFFRCAELKGPLAEGTKTEHSIDYDRL